MEIKGTGPVGSTGVRRVSRSTVSGDNVFKPASDAEEQPRAQTVSGPGPIAALETILTLQGFDDSTDGRSKGFAHGENLLSMLDQVRSNLAMLEPLEPLPGAKAATPAVPRRKRSAARP